MAPTQLSIDVYHQIGAVLKKVGRIQLWPKDLPRRFDLARERYPLVANPVLGPTKHSGQSYLDIVMEAEHE